MTLTKQGGSGWWVDDETGRKYSSPEEFAYFQARRPTLPEVREDTSAMGGTIESHPAFGQIRAARITSTGTNLYGSDFVHRGYVEITITHSVMNRTLSRDWPSAQDQIVSVNLSEAQWAAFISTLNAGEGVPCTIDEFAGAGPLPGIATRPDRRAQFKAEMAEELVEAQARIEEALALVEQGKMTKTVLRSLLTQAKNHMLGGADFTAKQFGEHVESTVEHAKVEIEAYMTGAIVRAGVKALGGGGIEPPLMITKTAENGCGCTPCSFCGCVENDGTCAQHDAIDVGEGHK